MNQQPVINKKNLKIGSVKIEISDNGAIWNNLGTGNKAKFAEKIESVPIESDNGGVIDFIDKDQTCEISYTMLEFDLEVLSKLRGGIDNYSVIAGTPTAVSGEALGTGWTKGKPIKLANKNGSNTTLTNIVVKAAGSALTINTDYQTYVGDGSNGEFGCTYIVPVSAQAGVLTADYTYTPNTSVIITSGGGVSISPKMVRVTNMNTAGKKFEITIFKAYNSDGLSIDFPADADGKVWETPIKLAGSNDITRPANAQLYQIINEQI
jgi:hypothetical protein